MARIANKMTMKMVSFANKMTMKMVSFANKQHIKNSHAVQWLLIANTHSTSVYIVLSVVFIFSIFWWTIISIIFIFKLNVRPELIFVTIIMNYIRGEKSCHVEKFGLSIMNLNNIWSFIKDYDVFVPNLYGEKYNNISFTLLTVLISQWPSLGFLFWRAW